MLFYQPWGGRGVGVVRVNKKKLTNLDESAHQLLGEKNDLNVFKSVFFLCARSKEESVQTNHKFIT